MEGFVFIGANERFAGASTRSDRYGEDTSGRLRVQGSAPTLNMGGREKACNLWPAYKPQKGWEGSEQLLSALWDSNASVSKNRKPLPLSGAITSPLFSYRPPPPLFPVVFRLKNRIINNRYQG